MKPKITIIDGNNEIELSTIEENVKAYMVKGEKGADGTSPTASVSKTGSTSKLIVTDATGTTQTNILDGYNPTITTSRAGKTTTITTTDINGTTDTEIYDGIDLTGGVPTNGVIGWDDDNIFYSCDGTETGTYYLTYNTVSYYFTMPTVAEGDILLFNTTDLELSLNGTTISTSSSGTGTELTFDEYIPNGYEETTEIQEKLISGTNIKTINNTSILGSGNIDINGEKNIITASISSNYTISTNATYETLILNTSNSLGSKLTLTNDGTILIGSNISYVKISSKVSFNSLTEGLKWLTVFNGTGAVIANPMILSQRGTLYSTDTLIPVVEGDVISIKVQGNQGDLVRSNITYTNITVEAVG